MTFDLEQELENLIEREGYLSDHSSDRGGLTVWGITERVAREHGYEGDMHALPRDFAKDIYRKTFWSVPGFDRVAECNGKIAQELFDTGVNCGTQFACKALQRALNAFNRQGEDFPDLTVDGFIGTRTLLALADFFAVRGANGETVLYRALNCLQGSRYINLAENRPDQEDFTFGWFLHRVQ